MIKSIFKTLFSLVYLNLIFFFTKNKNKKIIFFYHPKKNLTLIHTYYFENLFQKFPNNFKIFFGHNCNKDIGKKYFFIKEGFLKYLFNIDYFSCNNICDIFPPKTIKIYFHHNIYDDPWVSREKEEKMCHRLSKYNYIFVATLLSQKKVMEMFEKYKTSEVPKIIEVGYVKLDYILENYQKQINGLKNSILIAPTQAASFPELSIKNKLKKIIEILILNTDKNIILRPHPRDKNNIFFKELKENFAKNERFFYDESENYVNTYTKSEIMITDMSGTAYTFAYINLSPVIFFSVSEKQLQDSNYSNYKFYLDREKIGKIIFNENELIKTIDDLNRNKEKYKNQISALRSEMKYLNESTNKLINFFKDLN